MARLPFAGTTRTTAPKISLGAGTTPSLNINRAAAEALGLKADSSVLLFLDPAKREIVMERAEDGAANAVQVRQRNKSSYGIAMTAFFAQFKMEVNSENAVALEYKGDADKKTIVLSLPDEIFIPEGLE